MFKATPITHQSEMSILSVTPDTPFSGTHMNHSSVTEVNPLTSKNFIRGSFHQGDEIFSPELRGSQRVANSLCALIYEQNSSINHSKCSTAFLLKVILCTRKLFLGWMGKECCKATCKV